VDVRTTNSADTLAINGPVRFADNTGMWLSFSGGGGNLTFGGQTEVLGAGTGTGTFVEFGMETGNTLNLSASASITSAAVSRVSFVRGKVAQGGNNQIGADVDLTNTMTGVTQESATWDLNVSDNTNTGTLDLNAAFTLNIDFSDAAANDVWFANSSAISWNGSALLNLIGFEFGTDAIRFGTTSGGLTSGQLSQIRIDGFAGSYSLDPAGYLIPEPTTVTMLLGGVGMLALLRRRRA
jgi:hypothetical protein